MGKVQRAELRTYSFFIPNNVLSSDDWYLWLRRTQGGLVIDVCDDSPPDYDDLPTGETIVTARDFSHKKPGTFPTALCPLLNGRPCVGPRCAWYLADPTHPWHCAVRAMAKGEP